MTCSTWAPHPFHEGRPHFLHSTLLHIPYRVSLQGRMVRCGQRSFVCAGLLGSVVIAVQVDGEARTLHRGRRLAWRWRSSARRTLGENNDAGIHAKFLVGRFGCELGEIAVELFWFHSASLDHLSPGCD